MSAFLIVFTQLSTMEFLLFVEHLEKSNPLSAILYFGEEFVIHSRKKFENLAQRSAMSILAKICFLKFSLCLWTTQKTGIRIGSRKTFFCTSLQ